MKSIYLMLSLCFAVLIVAAQNVKPYLAIVRSSNSVNRGVLYKLASTGIIISVGNEFLSIPYTELKSIKIRVPKKDYEITQFVTYDPWSDNNFELNANGIKVRKWGAKDPTLGEEIGVHVISTLVNTTANVLAIPIHAINPKIANFKINGKLTRFNQFFNELNYFSIYYQSTPNNNDLGKFKAISADFKP
ncbi:hypothetical protein EZJ43_08580 [Pedobacter changchengzhani]|uniref:Uncharacterized protein n=1 Tax=Pedobacter changchengzhani TaxID=2529274 RepID=A0A4R5MLH5_9SPHI|nr:hypothetical protein [Pedobacter changchengzhani]TDG36560.1 hypothetical protein EZJ43_08580 [Pedobacter changchengzhani]